MSTIEELRKQYPYLDRYDTSKNYIQTLAVPGRVEQASEFTEIQTNLLELVKRVSNTILREGDVVSGMSFTQKDKVITIQSGLIYLQGVIHRFEEQSITISGQGVENIGVSLELSIATEADDQSFVDPVTESENYGKPGAHRIKAVPKLTLNDDNSTVLYKFVDNSLFIDSVKPESSVVTDLLARRTFDESGNYQVSGLKIWAEPCDANNINLVVESGKAYIMGYEVLKPNAVKVAVPKSKTLRAIIGEPKTYRTGTDEYPLNNYPAYQVSRLICVVQETVNVTRGSLTGGIDYLPNRPVVQIIQVTQGATTYTQGTDYQLRDDGVDWSLPSTKEPSVGSTYSVTYRYNKNMVQGIDFTLTDKLDNRIMRSFVTFISSTKPVIDTQFQIDYSFYLSRKDLVSINRFGDIIVTTGQSDVDRLIVTPSNNDPGLLHLGTIGLSPNSDNVLVNPFVVSRVNMEELSRMVRRIEDLEFNQAMSALDKDAMGMESASALKGILSDGFNSISKGDLSHPDFSVAYDLELGEIMLPTIGSSISSPSINAQQSTARLHQRLITSGYQEEILINQPFATGTMLINPYNVFNRLGLLKLTPEVDNWVDTEKMIIENTETKTYVVNRWWLNGGTPWTDTEKYLFDNMKLDSGNSWGGNSIRGTITSSTSKTILDEAISFMRPIEVQFECSNLVPSSDNLEVLFDNNRVMATPISPTISGTSSGTLRADSKGYVKGKFTIPENIRTGTREVVIKNANNNATASFTANGRKRFIEETVLRTRVTVNAADPLAQTFQLDSDRVLTSVGLYFGAKDPNSQVIVQIRNTVNGYPGQVIHAEKIVNATSIQSSVNGTMETKVVFDDPILCKGGQQYCVVVETDSDVYSLCVGELGKKVLGQSIYVTKQPYVDGVLFSSSNSLTWTAHQTMDLKFNIYGANFNSSASLMFNPVENLSIDRAVMLCDYLTPQNTGCTWQIKLGNAPFSPIENFEDKDLPELTTSAQLKADFKSDAHMSPIMAKDSFSFIGMTTARQGSYISRQVDVSYGFTGVKQVFEGHIPAGCVVKSRFSVDGGVTWLEGTQVSAEPIDEYYVRYTLSHTAPNGTTYTKFRARIDITSPSPVIKPKARRFMNILK